MAHEAEGLFELSKAGSLGGMDKRIGFLEAGFENALAAREAPNSGNVVDLNDHPDGPWRERERRFHQLLDALPAAIYTTGTPAPFEWWNERIHPRMQELQAGSPPAAPPVRHTLQVDADTREPTFLSERAAEA